MDIKKANVALLLGKIRTYLDKQPEARKKGKRFKEADKALARLHKLFIGKDGAAELIVCRKDEKAYPGVKLAACRKDEKAYPGVK